MARRNKWFLSSLWRAVGKCKAKKIFVDMGIDPIHQDVILKRFWDGVPVKSITELTAGEQRELLPIWDSWVKSWCEHHKDTFPSEMRSRLNL